nr:hypothetical protein [Micromonospora sp. DSM 115978]
MADCLGALACGGAGAGGGAAEVVADDRPDGSPGGGATVLVDTWLRALAISWSSAALGDVSDPATGRELPTNAASWSALGRSAGVL